MCLCDAGVSPCRGVVSVSARVCTCDTVVRMDTHAHWEKQAAIYATKHVNWTHWYCTQHLAKKVDHHRLDGFRRLECIAAHGPFVAAHRHCHAHNIRGSLVEFR